MAKKQVKETTLHKSLNEFKKIYFLIAAIIIPLVAIVTAWAGFYSFSNSRFEKRYNFINDKINDYIDKLTIITKDDSINKKSDIYQDRFQYLSKYQQLRCPEEPYFFNPPSVFKSFFYRKYEEKKYIDRFMNPNELYIDFPRTEGEVNPYLYKKLNEFIESLKTNLNNADFSPIDFYNIQLNESNFSYSNILTSIIDGSKFNNANLKNIYIANCLIYKSRFDYSDMEYSRVHNTIVLYSDFEKIKFNKANIRDSIFINTNLKKSKFDNVSLINTGFINCNLKDINFTEEQIRGIETFYKCDLDNRLMLYINDKYKQLLELPKNKKYEKVEFILNYLKTKKTIDVNNIFNNYCVYYFQSKDIFKFGDTIIIGNKQVFP